MWALPLYLSVRGDPCRERQPWTPAMWVALVALIAVVTVLVMLGRLLSNAL